MGPTPRTGRKPTLADTTTPLESGRKNTLTDLLSPLTGRKSLDVSAGKGTLKSGTTPRAQNGHGDSHGHGHLRSSLKGDPNQNIRITGVMGAQAKRMNGVYKPVLRTSLEEVITQPTFYVKIDDGNRWLEYRPALKQWQAKPTTDKGSDNCMAYNTVPTKCLPQECPVGQWKVDDGDDNAGFVLQPDLIITVLTNEDMEEYYAFVRREAVRVANDNHKFLITGASGARADEINGMYEASTLSSLRGDMPVYAKVGNNEIRLVYNATNKQWQVGTSRLIYLLSFFSCTILSHILLIHLVKKLQVPTHLPTFINTPPFPPPPPPPPSFSSCRFVWTLTW